MSGLQQVCYRVTPMVGSMSGGSRLQAWIVVVILYMSFHLLN